MQLKKTAIAGMAESGDVEITVGPHPEGKLEIELESTVKRIFGDAILETARAVLNDFSVTDAYVRIRDKGALDQVIRARTQAALCRAGGIRYDWSREDRRGA